MLLRMWLNSESTIHRLAMEAAKLKLQLLTTRGSHMQIQQSVHTLNALKNSTLSIFIRLRDLSLLHLSSA